MKLFVDSREPPGLKTLFEERVPNVEFGNLDIGDFIIKNDNGDTVMIFERKSLSDLISSIKDGRYNEQSFRLTQFPLNNHHIYYVIEGDINAFMRKNQEKMCKTLFSAMLSLSYKKGFSLLRTSGWLETGEFIIRFKEKLEAEFKTTPKKMTMDIDVNNVCEPIINEPETNEDVTNEPVINEPETNEPEYKQQQYSEVMKMAKKSNITKENIGEIMLAQIPGVSIAVAQLVMAEYKTVKNLINVLESNDKCLDNFKIECKGGLRKISKTSIKNIKDFLIGESE